VVEDQPPTLTLLSPDRDLVVGEKEKVPLTYDAKDDFGVTEVELVWERRDKKPNRDGLPLTLRPRKGSSATYRCGTCPRRGSRRAKRSPITWKSWTETR